MLAGFALLAVVAVAVAGPPPVAQLETNYLLAFVGASGCDFYRNGSRYDAAQAAAHMRDKYIALGAADAIATAELFIEKVASRSSLSGRPYEVSCGGRERVPTALWLREVLAGFRLNKASRESRDAL